MSEGIAHDMLGQFWHLHWQIASWWDIQQVLMRLTEMSALDSLSGSTLERHSSSGFDRRTWQGGPDWIDEVDNNDAWWMELVGLFSHADMVSRPRAFSCMQCMRARRIKFHRHMSFREFEDACREAWKELVTAVCG